MSIHYESPQGSPLGVNPWFAFGAGVLRPLLNLATIKDWVGGEKIPKTGAVIVICNHISYLDALTFTHFLYNNGRAPRYLGKKEVFQIPIIGRVIRGAGQIPVDRQSPDAAKGLEHAVAVLKAGHLLGVYPEGTLTRDNKLWPMKAKTGVARLAITTGVTVIPCASWGPEKVLPPYSKFPRIFPRKKISIRVGDPLSFEKWRGREEDPLALEEATAYIMRKITDLLEGLRGEKAPLEIFDPKKSDLPRTGNFKKRKNSNS